MIASGRRNMIEVVGDAKIWDQIQEEYRNGQ
jgi:hypothetical protein